VGEGHFLSKWVASQLTNRDSHEEAKKIKPDLVFENKQT